MVIWKTRKMLNNQKCLTSKISYHTNLLLPIHREARTMFSKEDRSIWGRFSIANQTGQNDYDEAFVIFAPLEIRMREIFRTADLVSKKSEASSRKFCCANIIIPTNLIEIVFDNGLQFWNKIQRPSKPSATSFHAFSSTGSVGWYLFLMLLKLGITDWVTTSHKNFSIFFSLPNQALHV